MSWLSESLYHALAMFWGTFWALVLGFGISAALQVLVSKEQMSRAFGRAGFREVALATGLGAASSSCSYAAAAAGRSAFERGAALVPMLAFMFASTNLVVELGAVLWLLMGWRFVLAEVVGALVLIAIMWLLVRLVVPKGVEAAARAHSERIQDGEGCCHGEHAGGANRPLPGKLRRIADAFIMDWLMLWKEIAAGFLIAGFLSALVPATWWQAFFLQGGPASIRIIENAMVGPLVAVASFVCSVGNIPLANLLWSNGISFGGVISFIYADLIVIPLILIYAKYFGVRAAAWITLVLYLSMVLAGILVDVAFAATRLIPTGPRPPTAMSHMSITMNYTSWLDLTALGIFIWWATLHLRKPTPSQPHR